MEATRVSAVIALTPVATLACALTGAAILPAWIEAPVVSTPSLVGALVVVAGSMGVSLGGQIRQRAAG